MSIFEKATRLKLRFGTRNGQLAVEDLWDLPLSSKTNKANLDDIARELYTSLKGEDTKSFVVKERKGDEITQLKFDIVKHVIDVRLAENEESRKSQERSQKKQKLLAILASKEEKALEAMSEEDLRKMVDSL